MTKEAKPVSELNELELYFLIDACGAFIWRMSHDVAHGHIPESDWAAIDADINKMREEQMKAVGELPRIGITLPLDENNSPTDEYWKWYRTWSAWHKDELTPLEWSRLERKLGTGLTTEEVEECKCRAFDLPLPAGCVGSLFMRESPPRDELEPGVDYPIPPI